MAPNPRRQDAKLEDLYARVPRVHCKGHCHGACCFIGASRREQERIERATGRKLETVDSTPDMIARQNPGMLHPTIADFDRHGQPLGKWRCSMLTLEGTCSVYELRPMICRIYGAAEGMECGYGCEVDGEPLTPAQGMLLVKLADEAGGGDGPIVKESFAMLRSQEELWRDHIEDTLSLVGMLMAASSTNKET